MPDAFRALPPDYNFKTRRYVDTYLAGDLILDQFFIYGPGYDRLFRQLNDLVGPEPLLPKKAYGFFQTEESDCKGSQTKLMNIAKKLRDHDIPVDTLILDLQWGDGCPGEVQKYWGGLDWAPAYSQPLAPRDMLAQLHDMHFDVMLIHHNAPNFPHRAEDTPNRPGNWTQQTYDEDLWWRKIREELSIGVDGLWQDTRQNDVTDSVIWNGVQNFYGASRRVLFMGNRDAMNLNPWSRDGDHMLATASLLASRRYPFRWTGDQHDVERAALPNRRHYQFSGLHEGRELFYGRRVCKELAAPGSLESVPGVLPGGTLPHYEAVGRPP